MKRKDRGKALEEATEGRHVQKVLFYVLCMLVYKIRPKIRDFVL